MESGLKTCYTYKMALLQHLLKKVRYFILFQINKYCKKVCYDVIDFTVTYRKQSLNINTRFFLANIYN